MYKNKDKRKPLIFCLAPHSSTSSQGTGSPVVEELCDENWLMSDIKGIQTSLNEELFGQHLVGEIVSEAVKSHFNQKNPKKPLVLSFHGYTGTGKTFVSDIIAKHLFKKGPNSKFVKKRISTLHYREKSKLQEYQTELKALIESSTKNCNRSLFIFDEVDKMPEGIAGVIKPYLDNDQPIEGIDYRKNIFLFLSNSAGDKINKFTLNHLAKGKNRGEINRFEMSQLLSAKAFKMQDGLKNADNVFSGSVEFYVPFLPLERKHVKQCAAAELKRRSISYDESILENVASEMQYFPEKENFFSSFGCKPVVNKVDVLI